jgi:putative transposase
LRDKIVDFVYEWSRKSAVSVEKIISQIGLYSSKFHSWEKRYGKVNLHNGKVPRDFWIEEWEREAILEFHAQHPLEGYRRLTYMMNDANVVAVSPATVYRVLKAAGVIGRSQHKPSKKGTGFHQPSQPHHHWHIDVAYINIGGTFYYLCMVLDGYSRYLVSWDLRAQMTETEIEIIIQRGLETFPGVNPRIISDNGPQFISRDFKEFVRQASLTHVRTSPFYPQSNGKLEALNKTAKKEVIRPGQPRTYEEAIHQIEKWVKHYNEYRLHSSIDYVTPKDKIEGRAEIICTLRDTRLEVAREKRKERGSSLKSEILSSSQDSDCKQENLAGDIMFV